MNFVRSRFIYTYSPVVLAEAYLVFTLVLFFVGPITYNIHNVVFFLMLLVVYHISTVVGYRFGVSVPVGPRNKFIASSIGFWPISLIAFISSLISNANLAMLDSIYPENIISFFSGELDVASVGLAYARKIEAIDTHTGSKLLNVIFFFIAWAKTVYIPYIVYMWASFGGLQKLLGFSIACIPILSGISTGTNKPVFDFVIMFSFSLIVYFSLQKIHFGKYNLRSRRFFVAISTVGLFLAVLFFSSSMEGRGVDYSFLESTSALGDISITCDFCRSDSTGFSFAMIWLASYLVQGYYGFSLAISQSFDSTYGFGNSPFLMRQAEWIFGISLHSDTFQYKIDRFWGETAQWHSAYSQFANDVHFIGVSIVMFVIAFLMAFTWKVCVIHNDLFAKLLMPLYGMFFVFLPANNQVFGYIETFSAFFVLTFVLIRRVFYK